MAIMTKADVKKLLDMDDRFLDVINILKDKKIIDTKQHRTILLEGYKTLVKALEQKKIITAKEAKDAMKDGFYALLPVLAK